LAILSRIEEGLNAIDKALELEKKDPVLWRLKATVLKSLDREREAEAAEQEADKIAPDPELSKEGILCQGCRGEEVVKLQQRLVELGYYSFKVDGFFSFDGKYKSCCENIVDKKVLVGK
jgi:hypothetical protein